VNFLELKNVSLVREGKFLLKNINLEVWAGYVHAIIGPNGAGKSTLAHTIMGLSDYRRIEGEIIFEGKVINNYSITDRAKAGITLIFQEPARFEGLSVKDFVLSGVKDKNDKIAKESLLKVGLDPEKYINRSVDKTLSGGERKRIELASVYAMNPKLLIMDEPDSGVDMDSIKYIFDIIKEIKDKGSTIILVTHSAEVLKRADHAFLICGGQIVDKGSVSKMAKYFSGKCIPCKHIGKPEEKEFKV